MSSVTESLFFKIFVLIALAAILSLVGYSILSLDSSGKPKKEQMEQAFSAMHARFGGEARYVDRGIRTNLYSKIPHSDSVVSEIRNFLLQDGWTYEGHDRAGQEVLHKFCKRRLAFTIGVSRDLIVYGVSWTSQSNVWEYCNRN